MNEKQLWDKFLEVIKDKLSSISYDTWFKDTFIDRIEDNKTFGRKWRMAC